MTADPTSAPLPEEPFGFDPPAEPFARLRWMATECEVLARDVENRAKNDGSEIALGIGKGDAERYRGDAAAILAVLAEARRSPARSSAGTPTEKLIAFVRDFANQGCGYSNSVDCLAAGRDLICVACRAREAINASAPSAGTPTREQVADAIVEGCSDVGRPFAALTPSDQRYWLRQADAVLALFASLPARSDVPGEGMIDAVAELAKQFCKRLHPKDELVLNGRVFHGDIVKACRACTTDASAFLFALRARSQTGGKV